MTSTNSEAFIKNAEFLEIRRVVPDRQPPWRVKKSLVKKQEKCDCNNIV